jgi:hypothetical protein
MSRADDRGSSVRVGIAAIFAVLLVAGIGVGYGVEDADAAALAPLQTGVSYVYGNEPVEFEQVRATGARLVLTPLRWPLVAPKIPPASWNPEDPADPNYDWKFFDFWVTRAVEAGLTPVLQVRGAPLWAQRCPPPLEADAPCNPDPAALAAFAKAATRRYSGKFGGLPRVRYWQGLNEPNLSLFFNPQYEGDAPVSPRLYRTLINSFYAAVKSVDPSNLVLAAGLGPIAVPKYTIGPMRFTRLLLCMVGHRHPRPTGGDCEGGVHFDIFDVHPYTTGGPTHEGGINDVELGDLPKLQELLLAADRAGRIKGQFKRTPLWVTELSWDSSPPDPGGLPMAIESQWTAEALYRSWSAGVSNFFWFSLVDFDPEPGVPPSQTLESGLYFWAPSIAARQPKEVLYAFRFPLVAFPRRDGLFFWGRTPTSSQGKVRLQVKEGGGWHKAGVAHADRNGMFTGLLNTHYGSNKEGAVRARFAGHVSPAFPMRRVGDFRHSPFG